MECIHRVIKLNFCNHREVACKRLNAYKLSKHWKTVRSLTLSKPLKPFYVTIRSPLSFLKIRIHCSSLCLLSQVNIGSLALMLAAMSHNLLTFSQTQHNITFTQSTYLEPLQGIYPRIS